MNYWDWIPSLWLNSFDDMLDSELDYGDRWRMSFNYSQTEDISYEEQRRGWMVYAHYGIDGSFCCSYCSREWDSENVAVLFRYRRQSVPKRGTVIMRPYGQMCHRCKTFVLPGFLENEVRRALKDLSVAIRSNCYIVEDDEASWLARRFDSVVASPGFARAQNKVRFVLSNLAVNNYWKRQIERDTVFQRTSVRWFEYRKNRITSSKFGEVLAAVRRRSYPPSLFMSLLGQHDLSQNEAVQHGIRNESAAQYQYMLRTARIIKDRGLFLTNSGLLGASPDGTVCDGDRIVEVKCPWSAREMTVRQAAREIRNFFLEFDEDGALTLKPNHNYWHQIQGAMHLTGANSCDLVIWTPHDLEILEVAKDPAWAVNIGILETFYRNVFLPHILSQM